MTRRALVVVVLLFLTLFLILLAKEYKSQTGADDPMCRGCNVILISVDTLRADHMGVYGYFRDTTPNIDAFAEDA
ncbi:MAG: sulfatase-like hydrolase/transferase, partial [Candidatus Altiarchaeota archaeon]